MTEQLNEIPYVLVEQHELTMLQDQQERTPPFPYIGKRRPTGFALNATYLVNLSGWRHPEPSLTIEEFLSHLKVGMAYAFIEWNEHRARVGEFRLKRKSKPANVSLP